jgi:hypothetical protein
LKRGRKRDFYSKKFLLKSISLFFILAQIPFLLKNFFCTSGLISKVSGNLKFKNGETGLVNSKSAGKIVDAYNKLSPENAKQMKSKMNSDVVGFMKVLHFVDKSAKAV